MYANSRFKKDVNEWGRVTAWVNPGDKVSQSDLGVSDDEWQTLINSGAVVKDYPDALKDKTQTPPAEYYRDNPKEAPKSNIDENTPSADKIATEATEENKQQGESGNKAPWQQ